MAPSTLDEAVYIDRRANANEPTREQPMGARHRTIRNACGVALTVTVLAVCGGALWRSDPDLVLARGYGRALADIDANWGIDQKSKLWLSNAPAAAQPPAVARPIEHVLSVGDRITIATQAGGKQSIEVTALEDIDGDSLGVEGVRFQVVTGRPLGDQTAHVVRFLFAIDEQHPASAAAARTDRAL